MIIKENIGYYNNSMVKTDEVWWLPSHFRDYKDGFSITAENSLTSCIIANYNSVDVIPSFLI